jgi:transcriptional regulator with XRE-family HTH domain
MYFSSNFKFLRNRKKRSQEEVAAGLGIKRSSINNYENEYALAGHRYVAHYFQIFWNQYRFSY